MTFFTHADFCLELETRNVRNDLTNWVRGYCSTYALSINPGPPYALDPSTARKERAKDSMRSLRLGSLLFGSLLAFADITGISPQDSRFRVGVLFLHVSSDSLELVLRHGDDLGKDLSGDLVGCGGRLYLRGGRVVDETLLGLTVTSWEQDQLRLVRAKSLSVQLELLLTRRGSSVVDSDANSTGEAGAEASGLKLSKGETTAISDLTSVPARARGDNGSQLLDGPWEHFAAFLLSALHSSQLLRWLVEVDSDTLLPVLAEMYVWDDVIVLDHC